MFNGQIFLIAAYATGGEPMDRPKDSDEGSELPQRSRKAERAKAHEEPLPEPKDSDEGGVPPQRNRGNDRREAHVEYLTRRLEGGAPPTPQAYARAARQWQHLPGAVRSGPLPNLSQGEAASASTDAHTTQSPADADGQEQ